MWLKFETDNAFHFDYFLAEKLGKTVGEVQAMPFREYIGWGVYFGRQAQRQELANLRGGNGGR